MEVQISIVHAISTDVSNLIFLYKNPYHTNEHENLEASTLIPFISVTLYKDNNR